MDSKWIMDLNIKCNTTKLLEENKRRKALEYRARKERVATKSMIHKRKKLINWTSPVLKTFVLPKIPLRG